MPYEIDDSFDKGDFTFFDVKDRGWEIEMLNIIIGENDEESKDNLIKEKNFVFIQDSSLINGPYEYYQKVKQKFFSKYFSKPKCRESMFEYKLTEYLYITCDSDISLSDFPPLTIDINNYYKMVLTEEDLFVKNGEKIIFLFITNKEERYSGKWYVGEPFLKKYIPVYDQEQKKIGFYKVMNKNKGNYKTIAIIGFIFFIICSGILAYLILYLLRKHRNKKIRRAAMEMRIEEMSAKFVEKQRENNKMINN